ncbi:MAG: sodium:solute symporter family protein [Myxococcota bacterium]|nr:sodium:solute symporter family protein [Myxococcota bacterium]
MSLIQWSWLFLVAYVGVMVVFGLMGRRRIVHADDFATARGAYGPFFLALAFAASTASGATFLGSPGLAYEWGLPTIWLSVLYPTGVYFGVLICMRLVATSGNRFGSRSIPEFLGDRYQSEGIRVLVSLLSLVLFFYLAGQLVSGLVMFETMLGLEPVWALVITTAVLAFYVTLGGAHADILTDGAQGLMMLGVAVLVIGLFLAGFGVEGGLGGLVDGLRRQDEALVGALNPATPLFHSGWSIVAIVLAHIPLGLLPHLGNKLWALRDSGGQMRFVRLAFLFGITLGMLGLGGLLARAVLGAELYEPGANPNEALPQLFIELFPTWLAALIGVGILSAIMSTADGLVVSSSQIVANDLYRRTLAPRWSPELTEDELDQRVLRISRVATFAVLVICMAVAWALLDVNIALIVWIGNGGMMAAFAGPLVVGALWRGVTRAGAYAGLASGFLTFLLLHSGVLAPIAGALSPGWARSALAWLVAEGPNPYSCAAMGEIVSVLATFGVSRRTRALPADHVDAIFRETHVRASPRSQ